MPPSYRTSTTVLVSLVAGIACLSGLAGMLRNTPTVAAAPPAAITASPEPSPPISVPPSDTPATAVPPADTPTSIPPTDTPATAVPPDDNDGRPELRVEKQAEPAAARVGDEVRFTLTVTNQGDENAENVILSDPVPEAFQVLDASSDRGDLAVSGNTVVVTLGTVRPGDVIRVTIRARVLSAALDGHNVASLATSSGDDDVTDNVSSVALRLGEALATPTPTPAPSAEPSPQPAGGAPDSPPPAGATTRNTPLRQLPDTGASSSGDSLLGGALGALAIVGLGLVIRRRPGARG